MNNVRHQPWPGGPQPDNLAFPLDALQKGGRGYRVYFASVLCGPWAQLLEKTDAPHSQQRRVA